MENELFYGSICFTDLLEKFKSKHSSFTKTGNGKIYCNINVWKNAEVDKYGNSMSIQLNSTKDKKESEGKIYIGNCKKSEWTGSQPITEKEVDAAISGVPSDDLPF
jgi:hypothetical protein